MFAENKSVSARLQDLLTKKQKRVQPFDCTAVLFILFGFHISPLRTSRFLWGGLNNYLKATELNVKPEQCNIPILHNVILSL